MGEERGNLFPLATADSREPVLLNWSTNFNSVPYTRAAAKWQSAFINGDHQLDYDRSIWKKTLMPG